MFFSLALIGVGSPAAAWGVRAHGPINCAALANLPEDGSLFLQAHADGATAPVVSWSRANAG